MTAFGTLLQQPWVERLGWTLVHFLWQGVLVACLAGVAFWLLRNRSAQARYLVGCSALLAMFAFPLATLWLAPASPAVATNNLIDWWPTISSVPRNQIWTGIAERLQPFLPWLVAGWLLGVLAILSRHLGGWIRIQRLKHQQTKPVPASILNLLRQLISRLRVSQSLQMLESALVEVPTVIGWLRPVILLPASALTGLGSDQLEALLAHELAHIRRHDYLVNLLQTLVETLLFYHPAVWWLSRHIRQERENCCDDLAAAVCRDRIAYARALLAMEELRAEDTRLVLAARGGSLLARVRRLVGLSDGGRWRRSLAAVLVVAVLLILMGWHLLHAQKLAFDIAGSDIGKKGTYSIQAPSNTSVYRLQVRVVGHLDDRATIRVLVPGGVCWKSIIVGPGAVNEMMSDDYYDSQATLDYSPANASMGKLTVEYQFDHL